MKVEIDKWIPISESLPDTYKNIYLLWTDNSMEYYTEKGYWTGRKYEGRAIFEYVFIGAIEPTHWCYAPEVILPPYPEKVETENAVQKRET